MTDVFLTEDLSVLSDLQGALSDLSVLSDLRAYDYRQHGSHFFHELRPPQFNGLFQTYDLSDLGREKYFEFARHLYSADTDEAAYNNKTRLPRKSTEIGTPTPGVN